MLKTKKVKPIADQRSQRRFGDSTGDSTGPAESADKEETADWGEIDGVVAVGLSILQGNS